MNLLGLLVNSDLEQSIVEAGKAIDYDALYRLSRDGLETLAVQFMDTPIFKEFQENPHYIIVTYVVARIYPIYQSVVRFFHGLLEEGED